MTRRRTRTWGALIALGVGVGVAAIPVDARASHLGDGVPDDTSIRLAFVASVHDQIPDRISARLSTYDGTPIGRAEIEFRRHVEFLGPRLVLLGESLTDSTGVAEIPIAAIDDPLRIEAHFRGDERHAASSVTVEVVVPAGSGRPPSVRAFEPPRPGVGLVGLASVMPPLIGIAVVGVWLFLAALTVGTLLSIRRGQPPGVPETEGDEIGLR